MSADTGEYFVGAYLKYALHCNLIDYNVRESGGGLKGLGELDVIGYDFKNDVVYLCEVTTHIKGLLYTDIANTIIKIQQKHINQKNYALNNLQRFKNIKYMFWSPYVPVGGITDGLNQISGLDLVINSDYTIKFKELEIIAATQSHPDTNPVFRTLQIMGHLK